MGFAGSDRYLASQALKMAVDAANAWFLNALKELCREGKIHRLRQKGRPTIYILSSYDVPQPA